MAEELAIDQDLGIIMDNELLHAESSNPILLKQFEERNNDIIGIPSEVIFDDDGILCLWHKIRKKSDRRTFQQYSRDSLHRYIQARYIKIKQYPIPKNIPVFDQDSLSQKLQKRLQWSKEDDIIDYQKYRSKILLTRGTTGNLELNSLNAIVEELKIIMLQNGEVQVIYDHDTKELAILLIDYGPLYEYEIWTPKRKMLIEAKPFRSVIDSFPVLKVKNTSCKKTFKKHIKFRQTGKITFSKFILKNLSVELIKEGHMYQFISQMTKLLQIDNDEQLIRELDRESIINGEKGYLFQYQDYHFRATDSAEIAIFSTEEQLQHYMKTFVNYDPEETAENMHQNPYNRIVWIGDSKPEGYTEINLDAMHLDLLSFLKENPRTLWLPLLQLMEATYGFESFAAYFLEFWESFSTETSHEFASLVTFEQLYNQLSGISGGEVLFSIDDWKRIPIQLVFASFHMREVFHSNQPTTDLLNRLLVETDLDNILELPRAKIPSRLFIDTTVHKYSDIFVLLGFLSLRMDEFADPIDCIVYADLPVSRAILSNDEFKHLKQINPDATRIYLAKDPSDKFYDKMIKIILNPTASTLSYLGQLGHNSSLLVKQVAVLPTVVPFRITIPDYFGSNTRFEIHPLDVQDYLNYQEFVNVHLLRSTNEKEGISSQRENDLTIIAMQQAQQARQNLKQRKLMGDSELQGSVDQIEINPELNLTSQNNFGTSTPVNNGKHPEDHLKDRLSQIDVDQLVNKNQVIEEKKENSETSDDMNISENTLSKSEDGGNILHNSERDKTLDNEDIKKLFTEFSDWAEIDKYVKEINDSLGKNTPADVVLNIIDEFHQIFHVLQAVQNGWGRIDRKSLIPELQQIPDDMVKNGLLNKVSTSEDTLNDMFVFTENGKKLIYKIRDVINDSCTPITGSIDNWLKYSSKLLVLSQREGNNTHAKTLLSIPMLIAYKYQKRKLQVHPLLLALIHINRKMLIGNPDMFVRYFFAKYYTQISKLQQLADETKIKTEVSLKDLPDVKLDGKILKVNPQKVDSNTNEFQMKPVRIGPIPEVQREEAKLQSVDEGKPVYDWDEFSKIDQKEHISKVIQSNNHKDQKKKKATNKNLKRRRRKSRKTNESDVAIPKQDQDIQFNSETKITDTQSIEKEIDNSPSEQDMKDYGYHVNDYVILPREIRREDTSQEYQVLNQIVGFELSYFNINTRSRNLLIDAGIQTASDLLNYQQSLKEIKGIGTKRLAEIHEILTHLKTIDTLPMDDVAKILSKSGRNAYLAVGGELPDEFIDDKCLILLSEDEIQLMNDNLKKFENPEQMVSYFLTTILDEGTSDDLEYQLHTIEERQRQNFPFLFNQQENELQMLKLSWIFKKQALFESGTLEERTLVNNSVLKLLNEYLTRFVKPYQKSTSFK